MVTPAGWSQADRQIADGPIGVRHIVVPIAGDVCTFEGIDAQIAYLANAHTAKQLRPDAGGHGAARHFPVDITVRDQHAVTVEVGKFMSL
jgi:hypothetical protein